MASTPASPHDQEEPGALPLAGHHRAEPRADAAARGEAARDDQGGHETENAGPDPEVERNAPDAPTGMPKRSWWAVLKRTATEFKDDELSDRAAALTYYSVLSLFPAMLVLVSILGLAGESTTQKVMDNLRKLAPGPARDILSDAVRQLQGNGGIGSVMAVVGLLLAVWSASGYIAAFIRSSNAVYDVPEGRPVWKVLPLRLVLTVILMVMAVISALIVVFTGPLASRAGGALGVGDTALTVWSIAKWPVLAVLVTFMIAILYWAAPNARGRGFRWVTPGSFLALLIWLIASAGFALYVANFASYNKTYGALAGVIVFLVWLWITNLAILLGLEFDAEMSRERAIVGGLPEDEEPYVEPRDTSKWSDEDRRRLG
ncbi:YihY/virulence factor BrkB family protein [Streptomyces sp. AM 2-1-1]|uniref:YihY/virulence factor BrkB family protein n=1 Tax=Streptomyces sp. AM 2-1-1 TaxID=3028709 RepID=UPI0023B911B4|nr:YihY/virulence factor BrkB family protein [Streptomyces sp. AM 2-1-1]WEH40691.1 YihY/virulence factor BrkB family protein [Streptomyces sp. AM 2-1-1]